MNRPVEGRGASASVPKTGPVRLSHRLRDEIILPAARQAARPRPGVVRARDDGQGPAREAFWRIRRAPRIRFFHAGHLAFHQHCAPAPGWRGHRIGPVGGDDAFQPDLFEQPLDHALVTRSSSTTSSLPVIEVGRGPTTAAIVGRRWRARQGSVSSKLHSEPLRVSLAPRSARPSAARALRRSRGRARCRRSGGSSSCRPGGKSWKACRASRGHSYARIAHGKRIRAVPAPRPRRDHDLHRPARERESRRCSEAAACFSASCSRPVTLSGRRGRG